MFNGWKQAPWEGIYISKERRTWTRSTDETSLSKDTVKRQDTIMEDSEGTVLKDEHIRKNMPTLYNPWTGNIYTQPPPYNYTWQTADYQRIRQEQCVRVLLESKNPDKCSEATIGEDFSSSKKSDSRPSNSLFQTARGSGATLSECTFFFEKAHVTKKTSLGQNYFKESWQKEAGPSYIRVLFDKEPEHTLGNISMKD